MAGAMAASPRHHLGHVVAADVGNQLVLAKEFDQLPQAPVRGLRLGQMLGMLAPIAAGDIIEAQRCSRRLGLRNMRLRLFALGRFYFFGFAPGRGLGTAVKAITSPLEIEVPVRRARGTVDGQGVSFLRCESMNASMSAGANILRGRLVPW